jgi:hypothetical protein
MNNEFLRKIEKLDPLLHRLVNMVPVKPDRLPRSMPGPGVYVFSEENRHLYVGRSNNIRARIQRHSRLGATYRMASFAFHLAREATGQTHATYKTKGSRADLMNDLAFLEAFAQAKARIRNMDVRFVEESDPIQQAILEIYVAFVLEAPYNDFNTH